MPDPNLSGATAPKVVVLGRAGEAQQHLQRALDAIGVQTLATGDLDQLDPELMRNAHPDVFLVSIDERTKDASLGRWQTLFDAPGTTVVFDDADVTSHLSGWDLARWARHLASKVLGKPNDVLPPIQADAERLPQSLALDDETMPVVDRGAGEFGQAAADPALEEHAQATEDSTPAAREPALETEQPALEIEPPAFTIEDPAHIPEDSEPTTFVAGAADFDALAMQFEAQQQRAASEDKHAEVAPSLDDLLRRDASELDIPAIGAKSTATAGADSQHAQASSSAGDSPAKSKLSGLELTPLDANLAPAKQVAAAPEISMDLSSYQLEPLVEETTSAAATGLIAIVAGLGGPDAVRQVLAGLPKTLPVPILLWQHLDAGKHDRLAQQLGKTSPLPVYLAQADGLARPGAVAVMKPDMSVKGDQQGWWFQEAPGGGIAAALEAALVQPASMLMVLSGADTAVINVAAAHAKLGNTIRVQTPDTCFDGAAAAALKERGVPAMPADQIAAIAAEHWPT